MMIKPWAMKADNHRKMSRVLFDEPSDLYINDLRTALISFKDLAADDIKELAKLNTNIEYPVEQEENQQEIQEEDEKEEENAENDDNDNGGQDNNGDDAAGVEEASEELPPPEPPVAEQPSEASGDAVAETGAE